MKLAKFLGQILLCFCYLCISAYAAFAIYFSSSAAIEIRTALTGLVLLAVLLSLIGIRTWKRRLSFTGPLFVAIYGWYLCLPPKMDAPWLPDVAVLPEVHLEGNILRVKNIRNFNYRSENDFDVRYYDKEFNLDQVKSVDLFLSYWGTTSIAHTIMSFGFENGDYLPISIETRKEIGEEYSAVKGFFKKYELIYVVADERDLIGLRVLHRYEDVYLYRLKPSPEKARTVLLSYLKAIEKLEHQPKFYNALVTNCTTSFLPHVETIGKLKLNWAMIANGYIDRWRYDEGVWGFDIPFEEFRRQSQVNQRVKEAISSPDFSRQIRENLPSIMKK